ncbi:hypothetical protein HPB50_003304 [Hyalomma asiaticum]|uniref:Uncharacterized protein n=1 Tax=Hyalomma asiaticum TaxID=266040 RepID=A0ACB7RTW8_HYAAI|nr:hypothetical protein HPB50_003304 [Hyalomma asiaticum]
MASPRPTARKFNNQSKRVVVLEKFWKKHTRVWITHTTDSAYKCQAYERGGVNATGVTLTKSYDDMWKPRKIVDPPLDWTFTSKKVMSRESLGATCTRRSSALGPAQLRNAVHASTAMRPANLPPQQVRIPLRGGSVQTSSAASVPTFYNRGYPFPVIQPP